MGKAEEKTERVNFRAEVREQNERIKGGECVHYSNICYNYDIICVYFEGYENDVWARVMEKPDIELEDIQLFYRNGKGVVRLIYLDRWNDFESESESESDEWEEPCGKHIEIDLECDEERMMWIIKELEGW